ncbi:MAG: murein tripeptide amidase MpaA [Candidatus Neomarinimicrobiota bacterium]
MIVERARRGRMEHIAQVYGHSRLGIPLEIRLPAFPAGRPLIVSGIHGDEPETIVLVSEALRMLPASELHSSVILCANPDGAIHGTRANADGVDLNRNFPASNWSPGPVFYRNRKGEPQDIELGTGSHGASEPEIQALIAVIDRIKPRVVVALHSALACIDDPFESELGRRLAQETGLELVGDVGYPTPGSFGSWAAENNLPLVTLELPPEPLTVMKDSLESTLVRLLRDDFTDTRQGTS